MIDLRSLGVITTLAFLPLPALAHHGVSGQFDTSQTFEVTGTITRIRLVNPHAYVYFDVTDDSGEVTNMRCELSSGSAAEAARLDRRHVRDRQPDHHPGLADRTDPTTCFTRQITFANGVVAGRQSSFDENGNVEPEDRQREREDGTLNLAGNWAMIREEGAAPGRRAARCRWR